MTQPQLWPGYGSPVSPQQSLQTWWVLLLLSGCTPEGASEELMQKTRHHREVGHLGCVIWDTLEKSMGGGKEGEEEEEKTEF